MGSLILFLDQYRDESSCIKSLSDRKWPDGFSCDHCQSERSYQLKTRPRIFECVKCRHQHSVTAGTVFHKTRIPLRKWFLAAFLMMSDKRGVSAMFLSRELDIRYETAWLMAHKLRHALYEREEFKLDQFVEADETFYGGRNQKGMQGRSKAPGKSLIVLAVEKVVANKKQNRGIKQHGFIAGNARIQVIPAASNEELGAFIRANVRPGTRLLTDAWAGYKGLEGYNHNPVVQGAGENAAKNMPIAHILFSNIKAWLNGTHHGVSSKHLPRYLREWAYRFNRRGYKGTEGRILQRAIMGSAITYKQLVDGFRPEGAIG
jgi:hypothetical protein